MQFKERLVIFKFQEDNIFTNALPFTDSYFHFFVPLSFSIRYATLRMASFEL